MINTSWNVYNFRLNLLQALQAQGYRIVVIAPKDNYSAKLKEEGFQFYHLPLDNDGTNTLKELRLFAELYKMYKSIQPDIILHYTIKPNIYGTLAAGFLEIPTINNISGLGTVFLNDKLSSKIARRLYRIALRFSKKVFFQNNEDMALFIKKNLLKKEIAERIPGSGIDTEKFKAPPCISKTVTFLLIARLIKDKGILEYIEAIRIIKKEHKEVRFQIVGGLYEANPTAVKKEELEEWIKEGLIEHINHTDKIKDYISKASCIVLPSYREGLSRSLLEAASMSRPIVTCDVPGCRDVVEDGVNGFLCKVRDAKSLANAISKIIALSASQRKSLGQNGREKIIAEFSDDIIIKKYITTIQETLS